MPSVEPFVSSRSWEGGRRAVRSLARPAPSSCSDARPREPRGRRYQVLFARSWRSEPRARVHRAGCPGPLLGTRPTPYEWHTSGVLLGVNGHPDFPCRSRDASTASGCLPQTGPRRSPQPSACGSPQPMSRNYRNLALGYVNAGEDAPLPNVSGHWQTCTFFRRRLPRRLRPKSVGYAPRRTN